MRILSYTRKSLCTFEQDRNKIIRQSLENRVHAIGISLVEEYLREEIPDELPRAFYDYLLRNYLPIA